MHFSSVDSYDSTLLLISLLRDGHICRAARALTQTSGRSHVNEDECLAKLRAFHPTAPHSSANQANDFKNDGSPAIVDHDPNGSLWKAICRQANGSSPGPSGWTGDILKCIAQDPECLCLLSFIVSDIQNGTIKEASIPSSAVKSSIALLLLVQSSNWHRTSPIFFCHTNTASLSPVDVRL